MTSRARRGMQHGRTPWTEKLRPEMRPKVVRDPRRPGRMLVPTPLIAAEEIGGIPQGSLVTFGELRERLAKRFKADHTCPLTTGIFFNILAGMVEEAPDKKPPIAPYWRVIRDDGTLSPKTPCGPECQARRLKAEGHSIAGVKGVLRLKHDAPRTPASGGSF